MSNDTQVMLGHGSGGSMMKRIIDEVFLDAYRSTEFDRGDDAKTSALRSPLIPSWSLRTSFPAATSAALRSAEP